MSTSTSPRRAGSTRRTAVIIGLIALAITFALVIYQLVTTAGEEPTPVATDPAASQDVAGSGETPSGDGDGEPLTTTVIVIITMMIIIIIIINCNLLYYYYYYSVKVVI